jgi:hypothetical protein
MQRNIPGNLLGFLIGTNFAPIANAMGGPKIKPLASIPAFFFNNKLHNNKQPLLPNIQDKLVNQLKIK